MQRSRRVMATGHIRWTFGPLAAITTALGVSYVLRLGIPFVRRVTWQVSLIVRNS